MANIFSRGRAEKNVFKSEQYLYAEHVPERLPHRDKEIDSLVHCLNPVLSGGKPQHVFAAGPTGVGKTACIRFVLQQLEEHTDRAKHRYINCFEFNSRHGALAEIINFLGEPVPRRGMSTDELHTNLVNALRKATFTPLIVLDEFDRILAEGEGSDLLYDLLRITQHQKNRFGLLLISNDDTLTAHLDARVKSSLSPETILFSPYSPQQLKDILSERATYAFADNALEKDVINVAAAHAAKLGGDARIALECLWRAGREAERENAGRVTLDHLYKAFDAVSRDNLKAVKHLSEHERILLSIVARKEKLHSGELYDLYTAQTVSPMTERRVRDFVSNLESSRLVNCATVGLGNRGKTRQITLNVSRDALLKALKAAEEKK